MFSRQLLSSCEKGKSRAKRWAKKIRGQLHYFGPWDDWQAALDNYLKQKDALHAGRKPRTDTEGTTVKELANKFLNAKKASVDSGELAYRLYRETISDERLRAVADHVRRWLFPSAYTLKNAEIDQAPENSVG